MNPSCRVVLQDTFVAEERLAPRMISGNKLRHKFLRLILSWFPVQISSNQLQPRIVDLEVEKIFQDIAASKDQIQLIWDEEVDTLLMGPDHFDEYIPPIAAKIGFTLCRGSVIQTLGLSVVVVPWMKGWALLDSREMTRNSMEVGQ